MRNLTFVIADMSKFIALIIDSLNHDISIGKVMNPTDKDSPSVSKT